ncbi:MAG: acyloxyacyl hydrolase [Acidobacteriaceae bacterium]|nr:acyloxyacyl hydrolase [Acidobacteriaceae bacterium]
MNFTLKRSYSELSRIVWIVVFVAFVTTKSSAQQYPVIPLHSHVLSAATNIEDNGLHRRWQYGAFFQGGIPIHYPYTFEWNSGARFPEQMIFYNAGFEGGWVYTSPRGPRFIRGRAEQILEVSPLWLAYHPAQMSSSILPGPDGELTNNFVVWGPIAIHGVSVTPLLFRWNFMQHSSMRKVPWIQGGSGFIASTRQFPMIYGSDSTSKINFTPQIGIGTNIFTRKNQSLTFAAKFIHISSAGLGKSNPGIFASANFSIGYSWWR